MLGVIVLSVIILGINNTKCQCGNSYYIKCYFSEYHYAGCHYSECHYAGCHCYECHYARCNFAEFHYAWFIDLSVIMLRVSMQGDGH